MDRRGPAGLFSSGTRHDDPTVDFVGEEGVLATADGRTIGWMLRGPEDGRVVGWFHGQPGSRREQCAVAEETLSRHGVRLLSIDRAGYGETSVAGLDRRDLARDLLAVGDHLGVEDFPVMAVSMGGVYALALAAIAPERITKVILISAHVMPYDDPDIVARLSEAEQADVRRLLGGRTPELEAEYEAMAASFVKDPMALLNTLAEGWGRHEQSLMKTPWATAVADSLTFGLAPGHRGLLDDGMRTVRPLEFELSSVRCPVRAVHGTIDDLEPYANLERAASQLPDCVVMTLPGMGHFGPWLWPDSIFGLLAGH
jgi:pimeloyl-ACP methyl ester carboxylesterase